MVDTSCPLCAGMGEIHRGSTRNNGRLFAWPCPRDCAPGGNPFVRTTVTPDRARKMAAKAKKLADKKRA